MVMVTRGEIIELNVRIETRCHSIFYPSSGEVNLCEYFSSGWIVYFNLLWDTLSALARVVRSV